MTLPSAESVVSGWETRQEALDALGGVITLILPHMLQVKLS